MTTTKTTMITIGAAAFALLLSGCTASANLTVPASSVAETAGAALTEEWDADSTVELDCGDDSVDMVEGTTVDCTGVNPNSGNDFDAVVTIDSVDGDQYTVGVTTTNAGSTDEPGASESAATGPSTSAGSFEELAAGAAATKLGYTPTIECGDDPIVLVVDTIVDCVATLDDGLDYDTDVTVTAVGSTNYDIDVLIATDPLG